MSYVEATHRFVYAGPMRNTLAMFFFSCVLVTLAGCPDDSSDENSAADGGSKGGGQDASTPERDSSTASEQDSSTPTDKDSSVSADVDASQDAGQDAEIIPEGVTLWFDGQQVEALHPHHQLLSASAIAKRIIYNHTEYQIAMDDYTVSMDIAFMDGSTPPYTAEEVNQGATRVSIYLNDESSFDPPPAIRSTNVRKTFKCSDTPAFTFAPTNLPKVFSGTMKCHVTAEEDGEMHDAKVTFNFPDE